MVPEGFRSLWYINPLAHLIGGYRTILIGQTIPDLTSVAYLFILGGVFFALGSLAFSRSAAYFEEWL